MLTTEQRPGSVAQPDLPPGPSGHPGTPPAWQPAWWVHGLVILGITVLTAYLSWGMWGWTYDDAFIIYRYARNFAAGLGMVYNPGEPYLGTSSAGYTLLLAALHKITGLDFLTLGSVISAIGFWITGVLVWLLALRARTPLVGVLAVGFTVANPLYLLVWGGEMQLLVPLAFAALLAYSYDAEILSGGLVGLAILTRQDQVVLAALLGAHYLWTHRRLPWRAALTAGLVVLPWVLYSWAFFGSPVPGTLEAKIAQGQAGWPYFLSGTLEWLNLTLDPRPLSRWVWSRSLVLALIPLGGLVLLGALWRRRPITPWLLVLGWAAVYTLGYTVLRVAFYGWYGLPLALAAGIVLAWGLAGVAQGSGALAGGLARRLAPPARPIAAPYLAWVRRGLAAGVLVVVLAPILDRLRVYDVNFLTVHRQSDLYQQAGEWLAAHGGPAVSAAYVEVGEIGYYSGSRVVDLLGLVTPGAASHVPTRDFEWAVQRYQPDYYLADDRFENPGGGLLMDLAHNPWFAAAYRPVVTLEAQVRPIASLQHMRIYQRLPDASLPPPLHPFAVQWHTQQAIWMMAGDPPERWPGQTITVAEPNLSAVALIVGKATTAITGTLILHLRRSPQDSADLRQVALPLTELPNPSNLWLTLRFPPLPDSAGQSYFFTVELAGNPYGPAPLALWSASDDLYPGGTRYEGDRPAVGDLCLRLSTPEP